MAWWKKSCSSWYVINICTKRSPLPVWYVPYQLLQDFLLHEKFSCYPWYQKLVPAIWQVAPCLVLLLRFLSVGLAEPPLVVASSRRYLSPAARCRKTWRWTWKAGSHANHGTMAGGSSQDGSTDTWWKHHSDGKSPNWGCGTSKWPKSMAEINGGDPKYLQVLWWSAKCLVYLDLPFVCKKMVAKFT